MTLEQASETPLGLANTLLALNLSGTELLLILSEERNQRTSPQTDLDLEPIMAMQALISLEESWVVALMVNSMQMDRDRDSMEWDRVLLGMVKHLVRSRGTEQGQQEQLLVLASTTQMLIPLTSEEEDLEMRHETLEITEPQTLLDLDNTRV
jgi:hypothetical protein